MGAHQWESLEIRCTVLGDVACENPRVCYGKQLTAAQQIGNEGMIHSYSIASPSNPQQPIHSHSLLVSRTTKTSLPIVLQVGLPQGNLPNENPPMEPALGASMIYIGIWVYDILQPHMIEMDGLNLDGTWAN